MGDGFQFIDIILFALVAGFLILRLRSVLGRRDGHHSRTPDPFAPQTKPGRPDEKVVRLPDRADRPADAPAGATQEGVAGDSRGSLDNGLTQLRIADPQFDPEDFVSGARIAFEIILNAYSAGDTESLKPLLSPEVFKNFATSIQERSATGMRMETKLVRLRTAELVEAYMAGRTAHVTVKFVSDQISALYDKEGVVVEGDPNAVIEVTDYWTFERDTRSADPNWALVATGSVD